MIEIKELLLRFGNILQKNEFKKDLIREIISKTIDVEVEKDKVQIKNNIIYLDIKPIYKNEIFLKKEKIILELEKKLGKNFPKEIR